MAYMRKGLSKRYSTSLSVHSVTHSDERKNRKESRFSSSVNLQAPPPLNPSVSRLCSASPRPEIASAPLAFHRLLRLLGGRGKGPALRDLRRRRPTAVSPSRESTVAGFTVVCLSLLFHSCRTYSIIAAL